MTFALRSAWASLRARPGRTALTAAGIAAAGLVLGVALTVAYALSTGFDRAAARADLPSVIARFDAEDRPDVERVVRGLPNLAAVSTRYEETGVFLGARGHALDQGVVQVVRSGRRGYAVVEGRDVRGGGRGVVVERGLAEDWGLEVGDRLEVGRLGALPIRGLA